ncbi:MAG: hypothetical protein K0S00_4436 [Xanthobacteraceae bacterium]|jgi:hypothetical protein|nr:hypothetical protein [Xanthobacteraceae bacterium]
MSRSYHKTADPKPTRTEMRRREVAATRAAAIAEYNSLKPHDYRRPPLARRISLLTRLLIPLELKQTKPAERPAAPVADLFAR